ncbi:PP2C family protein-serine/threonine phosphatase [Nocardioides lianchengensis]|uniref:Protein phosphatase n=1 Tax=Nocardioides lianchengensis TaxID=1045774 RepID=A0A1G7C018_9ACTN|nr:protein phosphatase 2C domain-containing protein [Nocardioides lianchengensis]NYG09290.1 protein phosphatase [Nocardioides lianchengensis]SDE32016.1 protein phosphatase [Nocardioides lianchengensis]
MLRFSGAGVSDVGRVRPHNEDAGFVGPYVALVADGVGGAAAGEVASATAAYAVSATALAHFLEPPELVLTEAADAARAAVRYGVQRDLDRLGMATTLTVLVCDGSRVVLGHVGDSRAYRWRDGALRQLSTDHTYVQHLVDTGQITREAAARHPWRNVVLRSVDGDPEGPGLDLVPVPTRPGDRLLLCSDGLTDLVDEARISQVLQLSDPLSAAAVLTQSALVAGGRDNITCIVLDVVEGPLVVGDGQLLGALVDVANVVDAAAVRLR